MQSVGPSFSLERVLYPSLDSPVCLWKATQDLGDWLALGREARPGIPDGRETSLNMLVLFKRIFF